MPRKPKRPCRYPGCPNLSDGVYCEVHRTLFARENAASRGYGSQWRTALPAHGFSAAIRCVQHA